MDEAIEVYDAPNNDGVLIVLKTTSGKTSIVFPINILKTAIERVHAHYLRSVTKRTPPFDHPNSVLSMIATGLAQPVGSVECALAVETVELGKIVLQADRTALLSLRGQIDKTLALLGGHGTVQ